MKSGYCVTVHSERESPEEPFLYSFMQELLEQQRALQRAISLNQQTLSTLEQKLFKIEEKLDEVLEERKRPKVEVGYR